MQAELVRLQVTDRWAVPVWFAIKQTQQHIEQHVCRPFSHRMMHDVFCIRMHGVDNRMREHMQLWHASIHI